MIAKKATKKAPSKKASKATKPAAPKKAKKEPKSKKPSALDAAAKALGEAGSPMNCQEMIKAMADKGYWSSSEGKTPHATLYSAILREVNVKGKDLPVQNSLRTELSTGRRDSGRPAATLKLTATVARAEGGRWPGRLG